MIIEKLQDISRIMKHVRWLDLQLEALRSGTERITSVLRKTPRGTATSYVLEAQLDEITRYEADFGTELVEAMRLIVEVDGWLHMLPEKHEDILRHRYLEGQTWKEVAQAVNYNMHHCEKLHREALAILQRIENMPHNATLK